MRFFNSVLFLLFSGILTSQPDVKQSLIVVHVEPGGGSQFRQQIFSYHFLNGNFVGRDELMSVMGRKEGKDYIRTDLGTNVLYKDRYLVTGIGNIIDLQEKKILFDGRAALMRCSNDSAVFYTNDIFKGKFYSVYDFKSGEYGEVKDLLFKAKPGMDIEFDKTTAPFRLYHYPQGEPKVEVSADMGYGQKGTGESHTPDPPLLWISASEFVYAHFNQANTEVSVYKVSMGSHQKKLIGKVAVQPEKQAASLSRQDEHGLVLHLGVTEIFIDLKAGTVAALDFTKPANGFSYECSHAAAGRIIKLNGKDLGKFQFKPANFKTGKNIAAFVKEITVGEESYQQGIAVWNPAKNSFSGVESDEVLTIVGWINK